METPDQLAQRNAQKPKGVKKEQAVRRELCSIITKGTAFHRDEKSTYLLAVDEDIASRTLGVAFVDAATGHFHLGQVVDDEQHGCLRTLLAQLRPDEIVINEQSLSREAYTLLRRAVPDGLFNPLPRTAFWADKAACSKALEAGKYFDKAAIGAAAGAAAAADNDEEEDEAEVTGPEARWPRALRQAADRTPCLALSAFGGCATYLKRLLLGPAPPDPGSICVRDAFLGFLDASSSESSSAAMIDADALRPMAESGSSPSCSTSIASMAAACAGSCLMGASVRLEAGSSSSLPVGSGLFPPAAGSSEEGVPVEAGAGFLAKKAIKPWPTPFFDMTRLLSDVGAWFSRFFSRNFTARL